MQNIEADIIADLTELNDRMSQYTFLVECGTELPHFPEQFRTEENLIHECQVNTWIWAEWRGKFLFFVGDSEALVIRGALSLLMELYNGRTREEIRNFSCSLLNTDCFKVHFTQEQIFGLKHVIEKLSGTLS